MSRYQKGKTNLDFIGARDSEWQWHQLGHMQLCTSLQTDNHASTPPLSFLQAGCPSCRPTNSVKALKAKSPNTRKLYTFPGAPTKFQEISNISSISRSCRHPVNFNSLDPRHFAERLASRDLVVAWLRWAGGRVSGRSSWQRE